MKPNRKHTRWLICGALALLLAFVCATALADVTFDSNNFPDGNFRSFLKETYGWTEGRTLTNAELSGITEIDCSEKDIRTLKGIEYFTALKVLKCPENNMSYLDVSINTALTYLDCFDNYLSSLDVSQNTALTYLSCGDCKLGSLDVSQNAALTYLSCGYCELDSLDVSNNTALTHLNCFNNNLTSLDVRNNTALTRLDCGSNGLTRLDLSPNKALKELFCENNKLTALDVSNNTALTELNCPENNLATLDVSNNTALTELSCANNKLTALDVSNNTALTELYCPENNLATLDVSNNTALKGLACGNNQLNTLNLGHNTALLLIWCQHNKLTALDVSKCPKINKMVLETQPDQNDSAFYWESSEGAELYIDKTVQLFTTENPPDIAVTKITLNKTKATLTRTGKAKNPTLQLKATVLPADATDKSVTWSSDKPKIAKVDSTGKVTALKAGTATITCKAKDGSGKEAKCVITVKDAKVTKITLNKTKATLKAGKTLQLKVKKFSPASPLNKKVKWTSSNKKVATVNSKGKVTAKKAGTCTITCTATDGSKTKATCKITVK